MATPIIQTTGSIAGAGTAGESRKDLTNPETVTFSDAEAANAGATYSWTILDAPFGSTNALVNPTTATPTLTTDAIGSWRIQCSANGQTSQIIIAVVLPNSSARIPSTGETNQYNESGNTEGWAESMDQFMRWTDANAGGGGGSAITVEDEGSPLTTGVTKFNFVGTGVTATEPLTDEIAVTIPGLEVEDEGVSQATAVTKINFIGAGVTATQPLTNEIDVTIPGSTFNVVDATGASYAVAATDDVVLVDPGVTTTVTLPAAASSNGRLIHIKNATSSATAITIDPNASETIDGVTTLVINSAYVSYTIVCDGTEWWII